MERRPFALESIRESIGSLKNVREIIVGTDRLDPVPSCHSDGVHQFQGRIV